MIIAVILLVLLCILSFFVLGMLHTNGNKILKGVSVNGVDIGNMTIMDAEMAMSQQQEILDSKIYAITYKNREISVTGEEISLHYSGDSIQEAYQYGRKGNVLENNLTVLKSLFNQKYAVQTELVLDETALIEKINVLLEEEDAVAVDDSYEILDDKILVTKGHNGVTAKIDELKNSIFDQVTGQKDDVKITLQTNLQEAKGVDFDGIYDAVYVEKKNASYQQKEDGDLEYTKEVIGVSFDKELAETQYLNLKDDETLEIALIKETPEVTTNNLENVLFSDVLATYQTNYNAGNVDRSTNLSVAARNINGTILLPGEEFSYNKEVGQRTYANGFKDAHVFSGGKVVDGLGGGICQISSTLYNAVLMANLEVTERKNHMMYPEYVKPSLDATVVWGSIDFKFKNNRETPIKIVATVKNGVATTTIYGKKVEGEPIVELESVIEKTIPYTTVTEYDNTLEEGKTIVTQEPVNGYVSKAYKILKDANGNQISKTLISSDSYKQTSKIITVGTKKVEKPVQPETPTEENNNSNGINSETTNNNNSSSSEWPTGWDTPENPYYTGN